MRTVQDSVLDLWRINDRTTAFLVEGLPEELWPMALPGAPKRTIRSVAVHLHNARRLWISSLGKGSGLGLPEALDRSAAARGDTVAALARSGEQILRLLRVGLENGGDFPGVSSGFFYGAMPRDAVLFTGYAVSHEAHHRGQLLVLARALGHRLPPEIVTGLWQWSSRLRETGRRAPRST